MADEAAKTEKTTIHDIELDGYKFTVDTDLLDDVNSLEYLERIENQGQVAAVLPLLKHIMGVAEYNKLHAYFIEKDGKDHAAAKPDDKTYRPRMRMEKLQEVYIAILEKFDPKG